MKIFLYLSILLIFTFISACDYFQDDYEDFVNAYQKILIIREKYQADSLKTKAEKEIKKVYKEYGFTAESFKKQYFKIAHQDPKKFYELVDSIRNRAKNEIMELNKKAAEKKKKEKDSLMKVKKNKK